MNQKKMKAIRKAVRGLMPNAPYQRYAAEMVPLGPAKSALFGREHGHRTVLHPSCQKFRIKKLKRAING